MSAVFKPVYPTSGTALTCNNLGVAASSATVGAESTTFDNTTTRHSYVDIYVGVTTADGTIGSDKAVYFWVVPCVPNAAGDGYAYAGNGAGVDAGLTGTEGNFWSLGGVAVPTKQVLHDKVFRFYNPPPKFSVYGRNFSGIQLTAASITVIGYNDEVV